MSSSNSTMAGGGSHQLVSEQSDPTLDPVFESNKDGSSGHGEAGGTTTARGRASTVEDRFLSIERTMEALTGTVLDLGDRFDKFERMLEEITRYRRDPESPNPNLHHSMAAPCLSPSNQMSNSPVMHAAMTIPEQTHEEKIRILTAAYQKYQARRDSKAFEEPLQKPNGELMYVPSTFPSPLATGHQQVQQQMPQAGMQSPALQHVFPHAQAQCHLHPGQMQQQEVPLEEEQTYSFIEVSYFKKMEVVFAPAHKWISRIDSEIINATMKELEQLFLDEKSAHQSKARDMRLKGSTTLDSIQVIKRFGGSMKDSLEGASFCVFGMGSRNHASCFKLQFQAVEFQ